MTLDAATVQTRLRDWLEANVAGWSNVRLRPLEVALGSGFSADIFFVDVEYDDAGGAQARMALSQLARRSAGAMSASQPTVL